MHFEVSINNGAQMEIVSIKGRIDANTVQELEQKLSALIDKGKNHFLADMAKVTFMSSAGLRVFLSVLKKTKGSSGDFKLACLQEDVQKIFDMTGFTGLFKIYSTVDEAMKSKGSDLEVRS